jgi:hypothetical protein
MLQHNGDGKIIGASAQNKIFSKIRHLKNWYPAQGLLEVVKSSLLAISPHKLSTFSFQCMERFSMFRIVRDEPGIKTYRAYKTLNASKIRRTGHFSSW